MANKFNLEGFSVDTNNKCTASGGFVGNVTGDVTGDVSGIVLNTFASYTADGAIDTSSGLVQLIGAAATCQMTLADGTIGQVMHIVCSDASNTVDVTPENFAGGTKITFASNESISLAFTGGDWQVVSGDATIS